MPAVKPERVTQNRVIQLFCNELHYTYLGDWQYRPNNSNIEEELLAQYLAKQRYTTAQISKAILELKKEANQFDNSLYERNKAVYSLLRYGIKVKTDVSEKTPTIKLINWEEPEKNDWAIAKEVTLKGDHDRRPDLVLYLNGLAIAVIELKKSSISIGEGIRQNISNQRPEFHEKFFSTVQILIAGNDSQGLRYGAIKTEEKYYLAWKEDPEDDSRIQLDKYLLKLCNPQRLLEIIHDFIVFDA
ncbi:MAG: type I restriction endonuclease, partial [Snowella sp.]|nr:type I restriction endonuclease [Snowella sp.]